MTHGVIINGETYVAERVDSSRDRPCKHCDLKERFCSITVDLKLPCEPADVSEVTGINYMRRVIFIQPVQTKEQSK